MRILLQSLRIGSMACCLVGAIFVCPWPANAQSTLSKFDCNNSACTNACTQNARCCVHTGCDCACKWTVGGVSCNDGCPPT
jgi:hypothetical protein